MKRNLVWLLLAAMLVALAGCGGGDDRPLVTTEISRDAAADGDIVQDIANVRTVTLVGLDSAATVFAGVDPLNDDVYRAFLSFPLTSIPFNAVIRSATLSIVIRSVTVSPPSAAIPIRIELVSFDPTLIPPLVGSYFDRAVLLPLPASTLISPPITSADVNGEVIVDVTTLMVEAQLRQLNDFQVRILQENDFTTTVPGLIEIDEIFPSEPLLTVVWF